MKASKISWSVVFWKDHEWPVLTLTRLTIGTNARHTKLVNLFLVADCIFHKWSSNAFPVLFDCQNFINALMCCIYWRKKSLFFYSTLFSYNSSTYLIVIHRCFPFCGIFIFICTLLRTSSTPILDSVLSSYSDSQNNFDQATFLRPPQEALLLTPRRPHLLPPLLLQLFPHVSVRPQRVLQGQIRRQLGGPPGV